MANNRPGGSIRTHPLADDGFAPAGFPVDRELIARLESSFRSLNPETSAFAARFYEKLFAARPQLRPMFPDDMTAQNAKLMKSLEMVIDGLKHPQVVRQRLKELGALHAAKGALPEHYPIVCKFMLDTMSECAGKEWNAELHQDWALALEQISKLMLNR